MNVSICDVGNEINTDEKVTYGFFELCNVWHLEYANVYLANHRVQHTRTHTHHPNMFPFWLAAASAGMVDVVVANIHKASGKGRVGF